MGFIKASLIQETAFQSFQKFSRLVLWEVIFILQLQSAKTQGYFKNLNAENAVKFKTEFVKNY